MAITKNSEETKRKIISAANALFAEKGFEAVSLREITALAGANVAAVNYHFGNKEQLIDEVIVQHVLPVIEERMRLLKDSKKSSNGKPISIESILNAFIRPFLTVMNNSGQSKALFCKLSGRCMSDRGGDLPARAVKEFVAMLKEFTHTLQETIPQLPAKVLLWRLHFSFGVVAHTLMYEERFHEITNGGCGTPNLETTLQRMIDFCQGGLLAQDSPVDKMKGEVDA